jgi:hypothetical protein
MNILIHMIGLDGGDKLLEYETLLVNLQQNMENSFADFLRIQESPLPGILILDRGTYVCILLYMDNTYLYLCLY